MAKISHIKAREILDSRGNPTVEVDVTLDSNHVGRGMVPSGASTGAHEALELRDKDPKRYKGKGVRKAVTNVVEKIAPLLVGQEFSSFKDVDAKILEADGTDNKQNFGANAVLGVSLAFARAQAQAQGRELYEYIAEVGGHNGSWHLPVPLMNILNGGAHADNGLDVQEFMIAPICGGHFSEALRAGSEIFHTLKGLLSEKGLVTAVGDEGGFAPKLKNNLHALELVAEAVSKAGYHLGDDVVLALDVASTELFDSATNKYTWDGRQVDSEELVSIYNSWSQNFPLLSIEDGLAEDDWGGWKKMTAAIGSRTQLVGDDLFVTNPKRIQRGIDEQCGNAVLVKINQIGSLSETLDAIQTSHKANFKTVMSHRSGETEDSSIADLCVATNSQQIKTGSLCRGERTAKYNQLLRISEGLGAKAQFLGKAAFN